MDSEFEDSAMSIRALKEKIERLDEDLASTINDLGWIAAELGVHPDMAQVINRIRALKETESLYGGKKDD